MEKDLQDLDRKCPNCSCKDQWLVTSVSDWGEQKDKYGHLVEWVEEVRAVCRNIVLEEDSPSYCEQEIKFDRNMP